MTAEATMLHDLDTAFGAFRPTTSDDAPHIVGIGGTTRIGSSSETALRLALAEAVRLGATAEIISGPLLDLPAYDPANDHRSPSAQRLVQALRRADGIILSTPSYHGGMSGIIKNAIDYAEDMRTDDRPYFDGRAVGVIVTAYGPQALGTTLSSVRSIVHALRGWPTPFAAAINSQVAPFENGRAVRPETDAQLSTVAGQVVQFARAMSAAEAVAVQPAAG
ncbi:NADPH-dependent FMN reductase [Amorphus orientalis]|uniref:FMN reductase n=1 Tax=Amorphus orientalis TaxID=649198 RepID=A0AAE4ASA8_9HYPH|nr:NADPH-dependent FMN reductase [Amorphus orientalis]MDQ0315043.1 FMN reductase [Amorphus orientalis]